MKCLQCCGELLVAEARNLRGEVTVLPEVEEAWTLAPSWQKQEIMGQIVMACVAVPTCKKHLTASEMSPLDQAVQNGKLLQGRVAPK